MDDHKPDQANDQPTSAAALMSACYAILASAAFLGGHDAAAVGIVYLMLAALVLRAHK